MGVVMSKLKKPTKSHKKIILIMMVFLFTDVLFSQNNLEFGHRFITLKNDAVILENYQDNPIVKIEHNTNKVIPLNYIAYKFIWKITVNNKQGYVYDFDVIQDKTSEYFKNYFSNKINKKTWENKYLNEIKRNKFDKKIKQENNKEKLRELKRKEYLELALHSINKISTKIISFYKKFFSIKNKGEFETTEHFLNRTHLDENKIYNFDLNFSKSSNSISYNADKERFEFYFEYQIELLSLIKSSSKYVAQNAFGVKKIVNKYFIEKYILWNPSEQEELYNVVDKSFGGEMNISCKRNIAKQTKPNIKIRIGISFISYNDKSKDIYEHKPEIDDPVDTTTIEYRIEGVFRYIIIYNRKTKKIYDIYY